jgi:hypothetical protein
VCFRLVVSSRVDRQQQQQGIPDRWVCFTT